MIPSRTWEEGQRINADGLPCLSILTRPEDSWFFALWQLKVVLCCICFIELISFGSFCNHGQCFFLSFWCTHSARYGIQSYSSLVFQQRSSVYSSHLQPLCLFATSYHLRFEVANASLAVWCSRCLALEIFPCSPTMEIMSLFETSPAGLGDC